ncbi:hypothetical protein OH491_24950 [Termitidicoccus mucosus]|uniref:Uncharacterized protein n=1 Tax=Termitidicoccus mucosus TaxID=1184151 RepID=A0A178IPD9_9BACT|nr:hypothetical protein AW736_01590 [Opitutaceae bacterium TSB47]
MNKIITTIHTEIGYSNNVAIVEETLMGCFGFTDNSHVLTAVAAHVWSQICATGEQKRWGTPEVKHALDCVRARLADLDVALGKISPEVAPLRLSGVLRRHCREKTAGGTDVALLTQGSQDEDEPVAVLCGAGALEVARQLLTAVNGRAPRCFGAAAREQ